METWGELLSSEESSERRFPWRPVAIAAAVIVVLLLAIFLPPLFNLGKYRRSITASMSEALGRPVYVGGMQLRLLPTPGIVMSDFTVDEDPAFGQEPALHAASVVASLRFTSLWRGRLEVSRISLDEASLNLVRNSAGAWSIGSVLLRASQIPNAPTAARHASARPRFPYIEATDARIDFKDGVEKKPFSLMNAEFSMWQASGDEWRLRLKAQPVRTDLELHLSDTGELNVEGSLQRAAALDAMPVDLRAEWSGAQLGQVSRLIAGMDSGWRGDLDATTTLRGNLGDLHAESRLRVGHLRRQEFQPASTVDVDATCRSEYRRAAHRLDDITCFWPIADGHLLLTGSMQGFKPPQADLQLEINRIPASFPVSMLELIRPGAQNVNVTGIVNGNFRLAAGDRPVLTGDATATGVALQYPGGTLALPAMHFVAPPPQAVTQHHARHHAPPPAAPLQNAIQLLPVSIPLGEPEPAVVEARFTHPGFEIHVTGQAALARLMPAAANFGLLENAAAIVAPRGRAALNLTTSGNWMRPLAGTGAGIGTSGVVSVEGVQLRPAFLPAPVEVASAAIDLAPQQISWQNVVLTYQKIPMRGSLQFPVLCSDPAGCPATFTLALGSTDSAAIEAALGVNPNSGFLGHLLTDALGRHTSAWPTLQGQIECSQLDLGPLAMSNVAAAVNVEGNALTMSSLDATVLGGALTGGLEMKMQDSVPHWKFRMRIAGASASEVASIFGEKWGPGLLNAETNLTLTGYRAADLASSAAGDFSFTWQNGALARTVAAAFPLAQFDRWTGKGTVADNALQLSGGGIERGSRSSALRGSISFDRSLDLTVETRRGTEHITGTLAQPRFTAPPEP